MRLLLPVLLLGLAACRSTPEPVVPPDPGDAAAQDAVQAALASCAQGDPATAIARLDTLILARPRDVDALATRGMCRRVIFAADSSRDEAQAAMDDLTAAIDALDAGATSSAYSLDRLYSHRAYVHESLAPGTWDGTVEDLIRATRAAPTEPTHRLDLGVARSLAGDTAGAITDLRRFLAMAPDDTARGSVVRRQLAALGDSAALTEPPARR